MSSSEWLAETSAGVASAQGLDVSNYNGRFPWRAQKGLTFGVYRMSQGLGQPGTVSPDPQAAWNRAELKAAGIAAGAYHFLDPRLDGAAQARYFVNVHDRIGLDADDMLWCDNETAGVSPAATAAVARAFMAELKALCPHNPMGVYTFISFASEGNCAGLGKWPLWLAYPAAAAPATPPPWAKWTFWQWGTRNGTDIDAFNGTAAAFTAWRKSFLPVTPPPVRPPAPGVLPAPAAPKSVLGGAVTLSWEPVPHATSYYLVVWEDTPDTPVLFRGNVATASYAACGLRRGTRFGWYVAAAGGTHTANQTFTTP
jgi:GH25 family lysozyme M1 (1,4-beta-N-acetylmuramidase)